MEHGHGAASGRRNVRAPSRAAQQAGRGAPARRRPRNGQHLPGRRSDGRRRVHAWRRHQPRGTRARAAAAHPAARSRTPTCDGRWRCRRTASRSLAELAMSAPLSVMPRPPMKQITEPITAQTRQPGGGGIAVGRLVASVWSGFVNPGQTEALDGACNPRCNQAPSWRYALLTYLL